jgi:exopolyphosphatase/pppGpp-phosphohydrolase
MKKILIDVGSSTVKVYKLDGSSFSLFLSKSIPFKKDFDSKIGISEINKNQLFGLIKKVRLENKDFAIKIFATAIFRKIDKKAYLKFANEFFIKTRVKFRAISQRLENEYLKEALVGKYHGKETYLLINIGGGSTELIVMKGRNILETKNIDLGVGTILSQFLAINNIRKSGVSKEQLKQFVYTLLPELKCKVSLGFYSGGELSYMKISGYLLRKNNIFKDEMHPYFIFFKDFSKRNEEIFEKVTLKQLEKLMPQNPTWMHGARACSAIAESICEKYGVLKIIPSDANLIDGVIRRDYN